MKVLQDVYKRPDYDCGILPIDDGKWYVRCVIPSVGMDDVCDYDGFHLSLIHI